MTVATAKLPGLITTSLILPHPILTAIACGLNINMNGHPLCSCHYTTILMLLHVIIALWFSNDGERESVALKQWH
jgi:hypothetical protein